MSETATDNMESLLLSIPVEIRREIYKLVLDTGTTDPIAKSRVYIIKDCRALRASSSRVRINDHTIVNVNSKSRALEQTCGQIRDEIQHYLGRPTFKFTNTEALMGFLGYRPWDPRRVVNENNHITLQNAARVVVVIKEEARIHYRSMRRPSVWVEHDMMDLADSIVHPFMITFVNEEGESNKRLIKATKKWEEHMNMP
jgi:hypothetical protein